MAKRKVTKKKTPAKKKPAGARKAQPGSVKTGGIKGVLTAGAKKAKKIVGSGVGMAASAFQADPAGVMAAFSEGMGAADTNIFASTAGTELGDAQMVANPDGTYTAKYVDANPRVRSMRVKPVQHVDGTVGFVRVKNTSRGKGLTSRDIRGAMRFAKFGKQYVSMQRRNLLPKKRSSSRK